MKHFILIILIFLFSVQTGHTGIRRKSRPVRNKTELNLAAIDSCIYQKSDLDACLKLCKKIIIEDTENNYLVKIAENHINLITDYSDYEQKPLMLYYKANEVNKNWRRGKVQSTAEWIEQGNLYREICEKYPDSKLAGFIHFLLAFHYYYQRNHTLAYLEPDTAIQFAMKEFLIVINDYPDDIVPVWNPLSTNYIPGLRLAPLSHLQMAGIFEKKRFKKYYNINKAVEHYEKIIQKYSDEKDYRGYNMAINATIQLLNIYCDWNNYPNYSNADTSKVRELCNRLLLELPNQGFEYDEYIFGETHPEALYRLAVFEKDKNKSINYYFRILEKFQEVWTGYAGCDATGLYCLKALDGIMNNYSDENDKIRICKSIINSESKYSRTIRGHAQSRLANIYYQMNNYEKALIELQKVVDQFYDIHTSGEDMTLGYEAEVSIKELKLKMESMEK